jgi:2-polyprenyl-6-methoxyphenol hydroxylase-like FAD-dependent oxidoreductase
MASIDENYDVVVVGGRVAGAATAMLLARAGHRVAVLERVRMPADTLSTHLVWPAGIVQLRRWGLLDDVVASGAPPLRAITNDVDGTSFSLPVWPESSVDALYAPRRTVLDPLLLSAAARAGASVHEGAIVDGLSRDDGRVSGVVGRGADGAPIHVAGRWVVGADGHRSRVAREAGAPVYVDRSPVNAVHYAYVEGLDDRGVELWYRTSGLMAGVFPTNGSACVWVNCPAERVAALREDIGRNYRALLAEAAPDLAVRLDAASVVSPVRGTPGLPGLMRRPHGPGWVLVGDAGCTKDPASAHGLTAAMHDAELAAMALDSVLRGRAGVAAAMRAFHHERDRWARPIHDLSWELASYEWDLDRLLDLQLRFAQHLVDEARAVEELPPWTATPERPAVVGSHR